MSTAAKHRNGQARTISGARRVVTQGRDASRADRRHSDVRQPVGDEQGQHAADHRVRRRAGTRRIEQPDQLTRRRHKREAATTRTRTDTRAPCHSSTMSASKSPATIDRPIKTRVESMFAGTTGVGEWFDRRDGTKIPDRRDEINCLCSTGRPAGPSASDRGQPPPPHGRARQTCVRGPRRRGSPRAGRRRESRARASA